MKNLEIFELEVLDKRELLNTNGGILQIGMWHWSGELLQGWSTFAAGFIGGAVHGWIDNSKTI